MMPGTACPRVQLPHRSYLLYQGPAEAALTLPGLDGTFGQGPNLWWPADRAWCVASEIDLPWTYIGGPRGLIDAILADDRIEALAAAPDDRVSRVEDWVTAWGRPALGRPAAQRSLGDALSRLPRTDAAAATANTTMMKAGAAWRPDGGRLHLGCTTRTRDLPGGAALLKAESEPPDAR
jgi:hypothetical protein